MDKRQKAAQISIRVTNKFKREYEKLADEKATTLPDLIRYILTTYLENERKNKEIKGNE